MKRLNRNLLRRRAYEWETIFDSDFKRSTCICDKILYNDLIMKKYILVDSNWKLKRYLLEFRDRKVVVIDPDTEFKRDVLKNFLFSYQLFESPLVMAKFVDEWGKDDVAWLIAACKETSSDVLVVSKRADVLRKFGKFEDLSNPKPWDFNGWIKIISEMAETFSVVLENEVKVEILKRVGQNVDILAQEIKKLSLVSQKPSLKDVKEMVVTHTGPDLFEFTRIFMERKAKAIELLKEVIPTLHPLIVVRILEKQLMLLAQMATQEKRDYSWDDVKEVAKGFRVSSFQIAELVGFPLGGKKKKNFLKLWDFESIVNLLKDIQKVELSIKKGENANFFLAELVKKWTDSSTVPMLGPQE